MKTSTIKLGKLIREPCCWLVFTMKGIAAMITNKKLGSLMKFFSSLTRHHLAFSLRYVRASKYIR